MLKDFLKRWLCKLSSVFITFCFFYTCWISEVLNGSEEGSSDSSSLSSTSDIIRERTLSGEDYFFYLLSINVSNITRDNFVALTQLFTLLQNALFTKYKQWYDSSTQFSEVNKSDKTFWKLKLAIFIVHWFSKGSSSFYVCI